LDRFLLQKQGKHWDAVPVPYVGVADLGEPSLTQFRTLASNSQRLSRDILDEDRSLLIEKLHLMDGVYLKRAAILLFHPDPEKYVTGAFIKIGFFRTNANLIYHDEVHGDLFSQVNKTIELLLTKYFRTMITYEGLQRLETYPVPEAALREALLNAVIHKDYASGSPVQISVYENRLLIWNSGQLPDKWTINNLLEKHSSEPYNPDIANAFFRAGIVETWGRGIERIVESCQKAGTTMPKFEYKQTGLWVEFPFVEKSSEIGSEKSSEKILGIIENNPQISARRIAEQLGLSSRAVEKQIAQLRANGVLKRIGAAKGGHWEVLK